LCRTSSAILIGIVRPGGTVVRIRAIAKIAGITAAAAWVGALLLVAAGASCGKQSFFTPRNSPTPTSSASPTTTATTGFLFVTNNADGTLSEFSRDLSSGELSLLGTTAVGAAPGPAGLALAPSTSFLYVANSADATIREFSVNTNNGSLAGIGSVSDGAGSSPQQVTTDPTGSFLYVTNSGNGSISQYTIASNGTLNGNGAFSGSGLRQPIGIAAGPTSTGGVYVADALAGMVISFRIQPSGSLTLVNSVPSLGTSQGRPRGITVDPSGAFVYATDVAGGVVSVFSVGASNSLAFLASYPTAAAANQPFDLALADRSIGLFLYTTNQTINTISDFAVASGVLAFQSSTTGLSTPVGVAADPTGSFLYAANSGTGQVVGYSVGAGGSLSVVGTFDTESPANSASVPAFIVMTQ
jgi:6-phosphogluconolactonase